MSGKTRYVPNRVSKVLRMTEFSLRGPKSALGDFYWQKRGDIGIPKAITATAYKLAGLVYALQTKGEEYATRSMVEYEERNKQR
jgi:hypothetical protein